MRERLGISEMSSRRERRDRQESDIDDLAVCWNVEGKSKAWMEMMGIDVCVHWLKIRDRIPVAGQSDPIQF
jgi:hypothetical protein